MQDLKRAKKKIASKPVEITNISKEVIDEIPEELDRACKHKHHDDCECKHNHKHHDDCGCDDKHYDDCGCNHECDHKHDHKHHDDCECHSKHDCHSKCEPCELEADECISNTACATGCCNPIEPSRCDTSRFVPYAVEVDRIYDTFKFQLFTDAAAPGGRTLFFDYEVEEVVGDVPRGGAVNVTVDKVCFNYSEVVINPGVVTLEDRMISAIEEKLESESPIDMNCPGFECEEEEFTDTSFEYNVSGRLNLECCRSCKGEKTNYKQKGLRVLVRDLVLELRGRCGCTDVVVLAYPARKTECGNLERVHAVVFEYNTLSAETCLPANGKSVVLRQEFQTALTVDCIGKTLLKADGPRCNPDYEFCVPSGIDVIMCLEEVVSMLVNEQIVIMGSANQIEPRVVDTFAKVCDFDRCPDSCNRGCGC